MYNINEHVLFLAQHHHFAVIPVAGWDWQGDWDLGKQPLISIHNATADADTIRAWASQFPGCNWAVVPGSGHAILDVDPRHDGHLRLAELEAKHGPLPCTVSAITGRGDGGRHLHFTCPAGLSFTADLCHCEGLTLATGSKRCFVLPPSRHASGGYYAWASAPWDMPMAEAPAWLIAEATAQAQASVAAKSGTAQANVSHATAPSGGVVASGHAMPSLGLWAEPERLSSAKGVSEGGRHRQACILIGRELGHGRMAQEIEPELLAWADRCNPPMAHADALRQLRSLGRKEGRKPEPLPRHEPKPDAQAEDTSFLPSHHAKPEAEGSKLPPLLQEFANAIEGEIEGDTMPVVFVLLLSFGSAVGRGSWLSIGADRHHANLSACVVAPTGVGKSEPWAVAQTLMGYVDADHTANAIGYGLGSGEGLIERLQAEEKRCLIHEAEFGAVLTKARREGSTLSPTLCNAWDGRVLEIANRGKAMLKAEGHHVSVWANVTGDELTARLKQGLEAVNGFGNRFLWLQQKHRRNLPFGGDMRCLERFATPLRQALAKAKSNGELQWAEAGRTAWAQAYDGLRQSQEKHWALGRARSQALRLTLIMALIDGSSIIEERHVVAGLWLWHWAEASALSIFAASSPSPSPSHGSASPILGAWASAEAPAKAEAPASSLTERLLGLIVAQPGVSRSNLTRQCRAKADAIAEALATLKAEGKAHALASASAGRKAECWYPGDGPSDGLPAKDTSFLPSQAEHGGRKEVGKEVSGADAGAEDFLPSRTAELGKEVRKEVCCQAEAKAQADPYRQTSFLPAVAVANAEAEAHTSDSVGVGCIPEAQAPAEAERELSHAEWERAWAGMTNEQRYPDSVEGFCRLLRLVPSQPLPWAEEYFRSIRMGSGEKLLA
ncbi:hypothetical protein BH11PLA2_BH11PLA2_30630 [soil metagenome]